MYLDNKLKELEKRIEQLEKYKSVLEVRVLELEAETLELRVEIKEKVDAPRRNLRELVEKQIENDKKRDRLSSNFC